MSRSYSRDYEQGLLNCLLLNDVSEHEILIHLLGWLNSDQTCEALEDLCRDCGIDYEEDL